MYRKTSAVFALRVWVALLLFPALVFAGDQQYTVARVINGKSLVLTTGDTVRLASIQVPNVQEESTPSYHGRPGEPLGDEAKQALEKLVAGHTITLQSETDGRDRHNRLLGQVYAGTTWLQGAMLREGYAMVYSFADTPHALTIKMLAEERSARDAKLGIWAHPYFRVITPEETPEFINRFKLVEGRVVSVHPSHGNIYINFFSEWKGKFALFISRKYADSFSALNLPSLKGKRIRVRGWIDYHNAPTISLTHPDEIEIE